MRLFKHNTFISVLVIIRGSSPLASAFCIIIAIYQIIFIIMLIFNKYVGEYFYSGKYNKSKHNKKQQRWGILRKEGASIIFFPNKTWIYLEVCYCTANKQIYIPIAAYCGTYITSYFYGMEIYNTAQATYNIPPYPIIIWLLVKTVFLQISWPISKYATHYKLWAPERIPFCL